MRVSKSPEERKKEIIEGAIKLFSTKGYEKTSITDIAKEINIAQGLCYRYFPSKEILFEEVMEQYATSIVKNLTKNVKKENLSLKEIISQLGGESHVEEGIYYDIFHNKENASFHKRLSLKICEKLVLVVREILQRAKNQGEIHIEDIDTFASFFVYGQIGILNNENLTIEEKNNKIKKFLLKVLEL